MISICSVVVHYSKLIHGQEHGGVEYYSKGRTQVRVEALAPRSRKGLSTLADSCQSLPLSESVLTIIYARLSHYPQLRVQSQDTQNDQHNDADARDDGHRVATNKFGIIEI
jgi:hypothetical protein